MRNVGCHIMATFEQIPESEWRARLKSHTTRISPFANERVNRMFDGVKHPVRDFLFEYFSYRPAQLLRWSPGSNSLLQHATLNDLPWTKFFEETPSGLLLRAETFPEHRLPFVQWAEQYLRNIAERPAYNGCFGLHEWAMVYREETVRHQRTPLRLNSDAIASVIESADLGCTHYDAYRFFTPLAVPRNRHQLRRDLTADFDQPGCVHVTMDLYKFAYKIAPYVTGELLADTFLLAWEARELDMRASPYELTAYGLNPIMIETITGRQEYVRYQQELTRKAAPLRDRLIVSYQQILNARTSEPISA